MATSTRFGVLRMDAPAPSPISSCRATRFPTIQCGRTGSGRSIKDILPQPQRRLAARATSGILCGNPNVPRRPVCRSPRMAGHRSGFAPKPALPGRAGPYRSANGVISSTKVPHAAARRLLPGREDVKPGTGVLPPIRVSDGHVTVVTLPLWQALRLLTVTGRRCLRVMTVCRLVVVRAAPERDYGETQKKQDSGFHSALLSRPPAATRVPISAKLPSWIGAA